MLGIMNMENDLNPELLVKARKGDMAAFEEIYRKTSGFVFNVALRIIRRQADAEDVAQEVFIKMHNNLHQFRFQSSLKTWLYRITVNTAINRYRKNAGEANAMAKFKNHLATEPANEPFPNQIMKKDSETIVSNLLAKLDPDQRTCIVLREMEGLAYHEISEILNIPLNTVRSRLHRAREALMEFVKKEALI